MVGLLRFSQYLIKLGVVDQILLLDKTEFREDQNLSFLYLEFIRHDKKKGQGRNFT